MSAFTVATVLFAAVLHAMWNALVKGAEDKTIVLGLIALGHVVPGVAMVALSPAPGLAVIPFVIASTVIHWGYYGFLSYAYRFGDLSLVYPIARGMAPVLIALGAQVWADEVLPPSAWAGIFLVSAGIMLLTAGVFQGKLPLPGFVAAMITALAIAGYSVVDGIGVRLSQNAVAYIGWLFVAEIFVAGYIFTRFRDRLFIVSAKTIWLGLAGGIVSGMAYALVLYAKTLAPLGVVSALRETSVIFAALIGVLWYGERPWGLRIVAAAVVALGTVIVSLA